MRSLFVPHRLRAAILVTSIIFSMSSVTFISRISFFVVSTISIYYIVFSLGLDTMARMVFCPQGFAYTLPICDCFVRCLCFSPLPYFSSLDFFLIFLTCPITPLFPVISVAAPPRAAITIGDRNTIASTKTLTKPHYRSW